MRRHSSRPASAKCRPKSAGAVGKPRPGSAASWSRLTRPSSAYGNPEPHWRREEQKAAAPQKPVRVISRRKIEELAQPKQGPSAKAREAALPRDASFSPAIGLPWGPEGAWLEAAYRPLYGHVEDGGPEGVSDCCAHEDSVEKYCSTCNSLLCAACFQEPCPVAKKRFQSLLPAYQIQQALDEGLLKPWMVGVLFKTATPAAQRLYDDNFQRAATLQEKQNQKYLEETEDIMRHQEEWTALNCTFDRALYAEIISEKFKEEQKRHAMFGRQGRTRLYELSRPRQAKHFPDIEYLPKLIRQCPLEDLRELVIKHEVVQIRDATVVASFTGSCGHTQHNGDGSVGACIHCTFKICQDCSDSTLCPALAFRWSKLTDPAKVSWCEENQVITNWQAKALVRSLTPACERLTRVAGDEPVLAEAVFAMAKKNTMAGLGGTNGAREEFIESLAPSSVRTEIDCSLVQASPRSKSKSVAAAAAEMMQRQRQLPAEVRQRQQQRLEEATHWKRQLSAGISKKGGSAPIGRRVAVAHVVTAGAAELNHDMDSVSSAPSSLSTDSRNPEATDKTWKRDLSLSSFDLE